MSMAKAMGTSEIHWPLHGFSDPRTDVPAELPSYRPCWCDITFVML